ncbi:unnamed protein product [Rotaria sp. Silwood1]|nr:unnamed protein product [Rotaria sp. Silwood1]
MDSKTLNNITVLPTTTDCVQSSICRTKIIEQQNLENFQIVWVDANIAKTDDNLQTISLLRAVINYLNLFDNTIDCYEYIATVKDEKVFLIISGSISQDLVPYLYHMPQVQFVYIYSFDTEKHKHWAMDYEVVRGTYTTMNDICEQLSKDVITTSHQFLSMSIISTHIKEKEINQQEASFMYFQLLTEILIGMDPEDDAKTNMINPCRLQYHGNESVLKHIDEFDKTYSPSKAIWWYTTHCFIYEILNKALRIQDIDILCKYRFFLTDLHSQIKQLHSEFLQSLPSNTNNIEQRRLTVYRGQSISTDDLANIKNHLGGLLSFNSFLSTSTNPKAALKFLPNQSDIQSVLFEITADYSQHTKPFCNIKHFSNFPEEEEVLFTIACVFRIESIQNLDNKACKVSLTMTDEEDEQLKQLSEHFRIELGETFNMHTLGELMIYIGKYDHAQQHFTLPIQNKQLPQSVIPTNYNSIGIVHNEKGEYDKALEYYEKALQIRIQSFPPNHPSLAPTYSNIGSVYNDKGEYDKALEYYKKALAIQMKFLSPYHSSLLTTYNNIGLVYNHKAEYDKALEYYEKALAIEMKSLPSYHPSFANTYTNIGLVYNDKGEYDKALEHYKKALEIQMKGLPPYHPSFATTYTNIGSVYNRKCEYNKALEYYEKALEIQIKSLPPYHSLLLTTYSNIGFVYNDKGEYDKALEYYEKALEIQIKSLPPYHPSLATIYSNIGSVYNDKGEYDKALEYYEKALEIQMKGLPPYHPSLATTYTNIGLVYNKKGEYDKALEYYEKALAIQMNSLPSYHPLLLTIYTNIGLVYNDKGEYDKALEYYEKALEIQLKSLPSYHPSLVTIYSNIGSVYNDKGEHDKTLEYYEKALEVQMKSLPSNHPSLATIYSNIGSVYNKKGKYDKALEYYEKALKIQM